MRTSGATRRRGLAGLLAGSLAALALGTAGPAPTLARELNICTADLHAPRPAYDALRRFARQVGLREASAAAHTLWHVHRTGRLPDCYLTKREARSRGWHPGANLWRVARGAAIGGDRFQNRERRLPRMFRYVEADLDYAGGRRGAHRLVFARSTRGRWRMWVTVDHYRSFTRVPPP